MLYKAAVLSKTRVITITTVSEDSREAARERIAYELGKPGRWGYLVRWIENGRVVVTQDEYDQYINGRLDFGDLVNRGQE